jgi:hypothetical protein
MITMPLQQITARIIASSCAFCISAWAEDAAAITQPNVILVVIDDDIM